MKACSHTSITSNGLHRAGMPSWWRLLLVHGRGRAELFTTLRLAAASGAQSSPRWPGWVVSRSGLDPSARMTVSPASAVRALPPPRKATCLPSGDHAPTGRSSPSAVSARRLRPSRSTFHSSHTSPLANARAGCATRPRSSNGLGRPLAGRCLRIPSEDTELEEVALWNQASLPDGADDAAGPISLGRRSPARHTLDLGHSERRREPELEAQRPDSPVGRDPQNRAVHQTPPALRRAQ